MTDCTKSDTIKTDTTGKTSATGKEARAMKVAWIIFLVAVFLLLIVAYLAKDPETGERLGSKAYHMLCLGVMRLDIALTYGVRYVKLGLEHVFKGYRPRGMEETIHRKEQRMRDYRTGYEAAYRERRRYNRKILE